VLTLALAAVLLATDPVPLVGRPADFSGAVGGPFEITTSVTPDTTRVAEPIRFTVRITGAGDLAQMRRPNLEPIGTSFTIEDGPDRVLADPNGREFEYTLRSKSIQLATIPPLKFIYFNPVVQPHERGFQTTYSNELKLRVLDRIHAATIVTHDLRGRVATVGSSMDEYDRSCADAILTDSFVWSIDRFHGLSQREPWSQNLAEALALARSRVLMPADPQLAARLQPEQLWYPGWLLHSWAFCLGYIAEVLACFALVRWLRWSNRRWRTVVIVMLIPAAIPLVGALVTLVRNSRDQRHPHIVIRKDTTLHIGNGRDYPTILRLPEGAEAREIGWKFSAPGHREWWCQVQLTDGTVGWVNGSDIWIDLSVLTNCYQ